MTELRRIEFSLPPRVGHYRTRTPARFCSPTAPQVRTLRRVSSWISYRKKTTVLGTSRDRHDPLQRALEWLRQLETGEVASRAAIARREGVSRARVTRILNRLGAAMAARYGRREIVIFAIYDAGAHQVVWRKDEIAKQEAELAITGQDGAVAVLFALQKRLTDAGINPYISNYKPD